MLEKHFEDVVEKIEIPDALVCDVCKTKYHFANNQEHMEIQEFVHIKTMGGYSSVFGDTVEIELDICQHCLKEKLGEYIRFPNIVQ